MYTLLEIPALTPRSIELDPPLSDDEFERLSERSDFARFERSREGTILMNPPAGALTSSGNIEVVWQLKNWWMQHRRGMVLGCDAGFFLPDGSMLNPDAAYVPQEQLEGLTHKQLERFLRLAPAFIMELRSPSDRLAACKEKMAAWMANGVAVGWLVDPKSRKVYIYEQGAAPRIESGKAVAGTGPVAGFVLDLQAVWRCFE
jgi:Uma2 family endonuclease